MVKNKLDIVEQVYENSIHILGFVNIYDIDVNVNVGVSECSIVLTETPISKEPIPCYYFNRVYVQPKFRNNGYGKQLIKRMLDIVKEQGIPICCDINPYGDLSYIQLLKLYKSFGFKQYKVSFHGSKFKQLWII